MLVSLWQVRRSLAVCFGLARKGSIFDCVVATPDAPPPRLVEQVRSARALHVVLGRAPEPPQFKPKRPAFRICWHRLRLWLPAPYRAVVSVDSDVLVVNNIDFLVQRLLARDPG